MPWMQKIDEYFNGRASFIFDDEDMTITGTTTVTASGTAHTKGSWSQVVASAPYDIGMLWLYSADNNASNTDTGQLLDIGIGAASSEQVLVPDILSGYSTLAAAYGMFIPIFIPEGTRISARIQAAVSSDTLVLKMGYFEAGGYPTYQYCENLGSNTSTSGGTDVEGGSWIELKASTDLPLDAFVAMADLGAATLGGDRATNNIGIGAAASEVQIYPPINDSGTAQTDGWIVASGSQEDITDLFPRGILPGIRRVPSGTRVAIQQPTGDRCDGAALLGFGGAVH